jgi:hypothetical protein
VWLAAATQRAKVDQSPRSREHKPGKEGEKGNHLPSFAQARLRGLPTRSQAIRYATAVQPRTSNGCGLSSLLGSATV